MADDKRQKRLAAFRTVADERIVRMNLAWIQFEQGSNGDALREFLRECHTLKGEASLLGFAQAADLAHAVEDALQEAARSGKAPPAATGDLVLSALDRVAELVQSEPGSSDETAQRLADELRGGGEAAPGDPDRTQPGHPLAQLRQREGDGEGDDQTETSGLLDLSAVRAAVAEPESQRTTPAARTETIRVTSDKLDRMRDAVGELLLARIRLAGSSAEVASARERTVELARTIDPNNTQALQLATTMIEVLGGVHARLSADDFVFDRLITELEATSRELRMIPVGTLFEQYPRAVRKLARELGRQVRLVIEGEHTEVDRVVLTRIEEPLLHLVRNAIDHGIEPPEVRKRKGRPSEGMLRLSASVQGRNLQIEVSDDGAGIDVARVRKRAVDLGLVAGQDAERMSDEQVVNFLFAAGMSTRSEVTSVSGRGIGLDVVMSHIEALGGNVRVSTIADEGTTFRLTVPITVAISSVLLMQVGSSRYALPASTVETVLDLEEVEFVDSIHGPAIRYGEEIVPILALDKYLQEQRGDHGERADRFVIARSGGMRVALTGTGEHLEREAVMKSAGKLLEGDPLVRAVVPLEDGSLALVLKIQELLAVASGLGRRRPKPEEATRGGQTVLVADDSPVIRDLVAEALRSHGLRVLEAADGQEALERLDANPDVELVVTDIEMPRLDGIGLIRALRSRPGRRIPAVVVSMRGSDADKRKAIDAGADAYLVKTDFSHKGLWAMIARFME